MNNSYLDYQDGLNFALEPTEPIYTTRGPLKMVLRWTIFVATMTFFAGPAFANLKTCEDFLLSHVLNRAFIQVKAHKSILSSAVNERAGRLSLELAQGPLRQLQKFARGRQVQSETQKLALENAALDILRDPNNTRLFRTVPRRLQSVEAAFEKYGLAASEIDLTARLKLFIAATAGYNGLLSYHEDWAKLPSAFSAFDEYVKTAAHLKRLGELKYGHWAYRSAEQLRQRQSKLKEERLQILARSLFAVPLPPELEALIDHMAAETGQKRGFYYFRGDVQATQKTLNAESALAWNLNFLWNGEGDVLLDTLDAENARLQLNKRVRERHRSLLMSARSFQKITEVEAELNDVDLVLNAYQLKSDLR